MSTSIFKAGAELAIEGRAAVLLRKLDNDYWQIEEVKTKRIFELTTHELHSRYASGTLIFASEAAVPSSPTHRLIFEEAADSDAWEIAKVRRMYVLAIIHLPNSRAEIERYVEELWVKLQKPARRPGYVTVYRWKCRFLAAGNDIRALFPRHASKGNAKPRYPTEVENIVSDVVENIYLSPERPTLESTLEAAIARVIYENKLRPESMQLPWPTRRLLERHVNAIPAFERYAARHGRIAAVKRFRSVQQHRTTSAPLERAEIDHTPLDLIVIDDNSGLPLGRPYLTTCIDDYSRCVLGMYVSFEPPSYFTVAQCLKHAFLPKVNLRKRYPAIQNAWNAHGVMRVLSMDNGVEFHGEDLEKVCLSLGIESHFAPRKTPWFKGKIERFQGTLNRSVAHSTPGTTFSNIFEKEDYDPTKFAVVRYSALQEILHTWIADVYHQKKHRALGMPPAAAWDQGIALEDILVPDDPARLDIILGKREERVLSHKGIELNGLQYNSPELTRLRRQHGDKLKVEIRVTASDLGHIMVLSPDKTEAFQVRCLSFDYANGLSEWQHKVCKRFAARELPTYDPAAWLEAKDRIRTLIEVEFMSKKQRTNAKSARFKNMDHQASANENAVPESIQSPLPEGLGLLTPKATVTQPTPSHPSPEPSVRRRIVPQIRDRSTNF